MVSRKSRPLQRRIRQKLSGEYERDLLVLRADRLIAQEFDRLRADLGIVNDALGDDIKKKLAAQAAAAKARLTSSAKQLGSTLQSSVSATLERQIVKLPDRDKIAEVLRRFPGLSEEQIRKLLKMPQAETLLLLGIQPTEVVASQALALLNILQRVCLKLSSKQRQSRQLRSFVGSGSSRRYCLKSSKR
jgi:hypothetical protein